MSGWTSAQFAESGHVDESTAHVFNTKTYVQVLVFLYLTGAHTCPAWNRVIRYSIYSNALVGMSWQVGSLNPVPTVTVSARAFPFYKMATLKRTHLALYGGVALVRGFCPECETTAIVIDGRLKCCGLPFSKEPKEIKRICTPDGSRRLSAKVKKEILQQQDYRCAYCWKPFGDYVKRKGRMVKLVVHFDHQIPFSYVRETKAHNILAACHVCNGLKSDHIFQTLDDVRIFLIDRRAEKGYDF